MLIPRRISANKTSLGDREPVSEARSQVPNSRGWKSLGQHFASSALVRFLPALRGGKVMEM